jgi:hypothetical protein
MPIVRAHLLLSRDLSLALVFSLHETVPSCPIATIKCRAGVTADLLAAKTKLAG